MSRNIGNKSAAPRRSGSSLLTGILVGMVIGAGMAAGLAWYIMKSPSPFVNKENAAARPLVDTARPAVPAEAPVSGVDDGKPRFEFYQVLTDKPDAAVVEPAGKPRVTAPPLVDSKPIGAGETYFLQAGSFSTTNDAEKLKARLALLGQESSIQTATIPDRGVWYRVRLGPYKDADELNRTRASLKQNGVDTTPIRAQ
ncbi:MAG TPA: SPOR domain-containing protein [Gallionella sp.]|jgi:cell division protein FtsN|nr:SPOR domain-containing protein [Gallionella sp.]